MKAIVVEGNSTEYKLSWSEISDPHCNSHEVIVSVKAAGVNRADLVQRIGKYPPPPGSSEILGLEISGIVEKLGSDLKDIKVGDRVCALVSGGGYATKCSVPSQMLVKIPDEWSFEYAAAIPEAFYTAYVNLFLEGSLVQGESVLIHGGSSGVGTSAIQLAHHFGCRVFTTVGSEEKAKACSALGADLVINYKTQDFLTEIKKYCDGGGVDLVLDMVGKDYLSKNLESLNLKGRLVSISYLSGSKSELDLRVLMSKRAKIIGSVLRSRSLEEKVEIRQGFESKWWTKLLDGSIRPIIYRIFPIAQANEAHQLVESSEHIGKVVLKIED